MAEHVEHTVNVQVAVRVPKSHPMMELVVTEATTDALKELAGRFATNGPGSGSLSAEMESENFGVAGSMHIMFKSQSNAQPDDQDDAFMSRKYKQDMTSVFFKGHEHHDHAVEALGNE